MWSEIKRRIALWLLDSDAKAIKMERDTFNEINNQIKVLQRQLEEQKVQVDEDWEKYKRSFTIVDLAREQLKGFSTKLLDSEEDIFVIAEKEDKHVNLLSDAHTLVKNTTLMDIIAYIKRNQIYHIAMNAGSEGELQAEINFSRGTVNGLELLKEEIERLDGIYLERHPQIEAFDPHKAL